MRLRVEISTAIDKYKESKVSLLVRLRVEIEKLVYNGDFDIVSLLVRLRVEIQEKHPDKVKIMSASS